MFTSRSITETFFWFFSNKFYWFSAIKSIPRSQSSYEFPSVARNLVWSAGTLSFFFFVRGCVHKTWDAKPVSIEMEHRHQRWSPCEAPAGSYWNQPPIVLDHCPPFHPSTKNLNHFQPLYRCFLRALTTPGFLRGHTLAGQAPPTERSSVYRVLLYRVNRVNSVFFFL